jgi:hypothetical protein
MSLDLLKNALYQAVKANMPTLTFYPEVIDFAAEAFPNLSFVEVETQNLYARDDFESVRVPTGLALPAAQFTVVPVIAWKKTRMRLQLRDSLGAGVHGAASYQKVRDQFNAMDRFLTKTRAITLGTAPGITLAELYYKSSRNSHDPQSGVLLAEFTLDFDPWRLLDLPAAGFGAYYANSIELDVIRQADNRLLITRLYP